MSSSEIKGLLKSAREAVKSKDYANTIISCKVSANYGKSLFKYYILIRRKY